MNCKPGDLAVITGVTELPENNGHIVEVLRIDTEDYWLVKALSPLAGLAGPARLSVAPGTEGTIKDCFLRPISGPSLADDLSHTEEEPSECPISV